MGSRDSFAGALGIGRSTIEIAGRDTNPSRSFLSVSSQWTSDAFALMLALRSSKLYLCLRVPR
jgi:hypothetical protein